MDCRNNKKNVDFHINEQLIIKSKSEKHEFDLLKHLKHLVLGTCLSRILIVPRGVR